MKKTIHAIAPLPLAKLIGVLYAVGGFIGGVILFLVLLFPGGGGATFGIASIIFLPLLYGVGGFLMGFLVAWVYNLVAKRIGGIQIEMEDVSK